MKVPRYQVQRRPGKELGVSPILGGPRALGIPKTLAPPMARATGEGRAEVEFWGGMVEMSKELHNYERQLKNAQLASELSTAKMNLAEELLRFEDGLAERNDPENYLAEYKEAIRTSKESFAKSLSAEVRQVFEPYFRFEAAKGGLRVNKIARRQQHLKLEADLNTTLDSHSRNLASPNPDRRRGAWLLYQQAVNMARDTKVIDPIKAEGYIASGYQLYQRGNAEEVVGWVGHEEGIKWLKGEIKFDKPQQNILKDLDEDTKTGLILRFTAEQRVIKAKVKEAREKEIRDEQDKFVKKMATFKDMEIADILEFRNEILVSPDLPPVGSGSKEKFLSIVNKRIEEIDKGEAEAVRDRVYLDISLKAYQGTIKDINSAIDAAANKEITVADIKTINSIIKETQNPALKEYNEMRNRAVTSGRKRILEPDPLSLFLFTADSEHQAHLFDEALRRRLNEAPDYNARMKLLNTSSKEYIVEDMIQTFKAQVEEPEILTDRSKEKESLNSFYK